MLLQLHVKHVGRASFGRAPPRPMSDRLLSALLMALNLDHFFGCSWMTLGVLGSSSLSITLLCLLSLHFLAIQPHSRQQIRLPCVSSWSPKVKAVTSQRSASSGTASAQSSVLSTACGRSHTCPSHLPGQHYRKPREPCSSSKTPSPHQPRCPH